ncbi:MAG: DUF934 domain-containing protein [Pseudomonadota bacterium]
MLIDRTGEIPETWVAAPDEGPMPAGATILPLERIAEARGRAYPTAVHLPNTADPAAVAPYFADLAMISVAFPAFADGRGFSIGRQLRERGFVERLRATGPVIADQFTYLLECGFDEVAVAESVAVRQPVEQWMSQPGLVRLGYQRGALPDRRPRASILERRRAAAHG